MGDPLKKVQRGDALKIPAETFNTFIDTALDYKRRQLARNLPSEPRFQQTGVFKVRNLSGADRDRFDVLGLVEPIIDPVENVQQFKNEPTFEGVKPLDPEHRGRFAVLLEPVKANEIAHYACISGVCVARVNVLAEWHPRADVSHDDPSCLASCRTGSARILWKQPGLGLKWALVKIGLGYEEDFWARLGEAVLVGPNRWLYPFTEVIHTGTGYGGWVDKPDGRSGEAYNGVEDPNDGAGVEGNGVDVDKLEACCNRLMAACCEQAPGCDCRLLPAGVGAIVRMKELYHGVGSLPRIEYWFQYENEVECCPQSSSSSSPSSPSSPQSSSPGPSPSSSPGPSESPVPSSASPVPSSGSPGPTLDVVTCNIRNRCGHYFVFDQVRLHLPPGTWIEPIAPTVVPIFECQESASSGSPSSPSSQPSSGNPSGSGQSSLTSGPSPSETSQQSSPQPSGSPSNGESSENPSNPSSIQPSGGQSSAEPSSPGGSQPSGQGSSQPSGGQSSPDGSQTSGEESSAGDGSEPSGNPSGSTGSATSAEPSSETGGSP